MTPRRAGHAWAAPRVEPASVHDEAVELLWRRAQAAGGVSTPFLTHEWCSALADTPGACDGLAVLVAWRGEEPIGLFPVERAADQRVTMVGPAGWRWLAPDHLDVVASAADRAEAASALAWHVACRMDWDIADFQGLAWYGALARALREALGFPRFACHAGEQPSPVVGLASKGERELLPSRNLRQQVRRGLRAVERRGGGLSVVTDEETLPRLLETTMRLHNKRFGDYSEAFSKPARRRFHLVAARRMAAAGMARIYRLTSDGADAGLLYAFAFRRRLYYYSMGIAPELAPSPGRTVLGQAVLHAAAEGFDEFDLLRGDHHYKWRFADRKRIDVTVRALRLRPRSVALAVPSIAARVIRRSTRLPSS